MACVLGYLCVISGDGEAQRVLSLNSSEERNVSWLVQVPW